MKTFFYTVRETDCASCHYGECPDRFLSRLTRAGVSGLLQLNGGVSRLVDSPGAGPCCDDIVILHVASEHELDQLIAGRDLLEGFRKILVVGADAAIDTSRCHLLAPRFITREERGVEEIAAVWGKMTQQHHAPEGQELRKEQA